MVGAENVTTILITLIALGVMVWGFVRSRRFGRLGLYAWMQSVVLTAPWLLFFGLAAFGLYLNFAALLFLFVIATVVYILLGRQIRILGQDSKIREQLERMINLPDTEGTNATANPGEESANQAEGTETGGELNSAAAKVATVTPDMHPIPAEDLATIKGIFGIDTFFATETIPYQDGAIFKGNLRGDPTIARQKLGDNLTRKLGEQYRLFLVNGPEERPTVIILPASNDPKPATIGLWVFSGALLVATIATCLECAGIIQGFEVFTSTDRVIETLPMGLSLVSVLLAHEAGHQVIGRRNGIPISPPFFIPASQLGSFGAITRFEAFLPNRSVLFDISAAGPIAGGALALVLLLIGLGLSVSYTGPIEIPSQFFQGSLLVGLLAKTILGSELKDELLKIHPLVVVGWLGLIINALNLMPAGQLDGGRMIQAIYGRVALRWTTIATAVILAIVSLGNPISLYWAALILFLQRQPERPSYDELTEPDDTRAAICLVLLFLMLAVLLPLSPSLAGRLGIGVNLPIPMPLDL
jgi:membrane-associated protease RseP (regulator of RpoE activity)